MLKDLKCDEVSKKVGGKFKLSCLMQKRMTEIMQGSRPLIDEVRGKTLMEIVLEEIKLDKIAIDYDASGITRPETIKP